MSSIQSSNLQAIYRGFRKQINNKIINDEDKAKIVTSIKATLKALSSTSSDFSLGEKVFKKDEIVEGNNPKLIAYVARKLFNVCELSATDAEELLVGLEQFRTKVPNADFPITRAEFALLAGAKLGEPTPKGEPENLLSSIAQALETSLQNTQKKIKWIKSNP